MYTAIYRYRYACTCRCGNAPIRPRPGRPSGQIACCPSGLNSTRHTDGRTDRRIDRPSPLTRLMCIRVELQARASHQSHSKCPTPAGRHTLNTYPPPLPRPPGLSLDSSTLSTTHTNTRTHTRIWASQQCRRPVTLCFRHFKCTNGSSARPLN